MVKARVTATDRLSNVIEVVELGRRSGMLAVERGTGATFEEGGIYFVGGHPTYAVTGNLVGQEALAALAQWGACRFAFQSDIPQPTPNISGPLRPVSPPAERGAVSQPGIPSPAVGGGASGFDWGTPARQPAYSSGGSGQLAPGGSWGSSQPGEAWSSSQPSRANASAVGPLGRRPRRAPDVRDLMATVITYNLSRSHRTILLLADGSHNVLDLARLASKSVDEVMQLLAELEVRGLIYYYE